MGCSHQENDRFFIVHYVRETPADFECLKNLLCSEKLVKSTRDVVFDISATPMLVSAEIGILARFLRAVIKSRRIIHIIAGEKSIKTLQSTMLTQTAALHLYQDSAQFKSCMESA